MSNDTTTPSVPAGDTAIEAIALFFDKKADDLANVLCYSTEGKLTYGQCKSVEMNLEQHFLLVKLAEEVRAMKSEQPVEQAAATGPATSNVESYASVTLSGDEVVFLSHLLTCSPWRALGAFFRRHVGMAIAGNWPTFLESRRTRGLSATPWPLSPHPATRPAAPLPPPRGRSLPSPSSRRQGRCRMKRYASCTRVRRFKASIIGSTTHAPPSPPRRRASHDRQDHRCAEALQGAA